MGGLAAIGIALAAWSAAPEPEATNNNALNAGSSAATQGLTVDASSNAGNWIDALAENLGTSIDTDGNFLVDFHGDVPMTRNVLRLRVRSFAGAARNEYFVRVTANRAGSLGSLMYKRLQRPPKPGVPLLQVPENAVSLEGETGEVIVSGTAPIIAVKKGTIASDGTTFAVEADASGWWLSIIEIDPSKPVRVWFPDVKSAVREFTEPKCWFFKNGDYNPDNATEVTGGACTSLKAYATTIMKRTP